jgi:hypothetical protein
MTKVFIIIVGHSSSGTEASSSVLTAPTSALASTKAHDAPSN